MANSRKHLERRRFAYARSYAGREFRLGPLLPIIRTLSDPQTVKLAVQTKRQLGQKKYPTRLIAEVQRQLLNPPSEDAFRDGT